MLLSEKVKILRKKKGISQQQLADLLDIHLTNLNRLEKGHSQPSIDVIKKLVNIFEVSADYLLNDQIDSFEIDIEHKNIADKIRLIDKLEDKDREALIQVIDTMLTKQKMRDVLNQQMTSSQ